MTTKDKPKDNQEINRKIAERLDKFNKEQEDERRRSKSENRGVKE
jgi:hypothetical protein